MDKEKALKILELTAEASPEDVEKRIAVLYKKFRYNRYDERGYTLEDVEKAYNFLMGITFVDAEAENKKKYRKEHPNPILKLLKIDEEKARNFFYYHKWHIVGVLAAVIAIISIIVSIAGNVDPDLKILFAGNIYVRDSEAMAQDLSNKLEEVEKAQVISVYLSGAFESEADWAMQTKFTVELAAGNNDIFILDEEKYFQLAKQGALQPIESVLGDISSLGIDHNKQSDLIAAIEQEGEEIGEQKLYGIDISGNRYLQEFGVDGERLILTFSLTGKFPESAKAFAMEILK